VLTVDHYVTNVSRVPAIEGERTALYVRERVVAGQLARTANFADKVVLFVHGAGTPAEVAFDVPVGSYSWMAHLARAGFDVFSMDVTGYGRSTRPAVMNDPCNLSEMQRAGIAADGCTPSYGFAVGNIEADWHDIDAVVDYIADLRGVERVSLVGWSLGGPRAGGYAARNPGKVDRIVLLAPAYDRARDDAAPDPLPQPGAAFTKQSRADFISNWDRQVGCDAQYDPAVAAAVWDEMLASDPVGATWGPGVRRAPSTTVWGWNSATVRRMRTPMLIVQGIHDAQVTADRARDLYEDLGASSKVLIDLGCASHNAMWERVHGLMFDASVEWLMQGTVSGQTQGILRMGY
jgi:pimeloyl-ACP methyl ester carboxylesterase